tara:strand:- start:7859 stop:8617 length:759 start_codon:yes stop_codon:yes gene_type:complete
LEFNFKDKAVLITGSSKGIGKEIAKDFLNNGANIIINGRDANTLRKTLIEFDLSQYHGIKADVSDQIQAKFLVEKAVTILGKIDIIVCNVGSGKSVKPGFEDYSEWQRVFNQNLWSTTNIIESGKKYLKKSKGVFVCISSICGNEFIENAPITYSTAKAALNFYINSISRPLGSEGIRINGISPGNILFNDSIWAKKIQENPNAVRQTLENVPLSKLGKAEDISKMCLWLASDYCSFCSGSIITVDGGQTRN